MFFLNVNLPNYIYSSYVWVSTIAVTFIRRRFSSSQYKLSFWNDYYIDATWCKNSKINVRSTLKLRAVFTDRERPEAFLKKKKEWPLKKKNTIAYSKRLPINYNCFCFNIKRHKQTQQHTKLNCFKFFWFFVLFFLSLPHSHIHILPLSLSLMDGNLANKHNSTSNENKQFYFFSLRAFEDSCRKHKRIHEYDFHKQIKHELYYEFEEYFYARFFFPNIIFFFRYQEGGGCFTKFNFVGRVKKIFVL